MFRETVFDKLVTRIFAVVAIESFLCVVEADNKYTSYTWSNATLVNLNEWLSYLHNGASVIKCFIKGIIFIHWNTKILSLVVFKIIQQKISIYWNMTTLSVEI